MKNNDRGFTLIELMIVAAVLGILVAIAIPTYAVTAIIARHNTCKNNLRALDGAIAQFQSLEGTIPADLPALVSGGYLKSVPRDPHPGYGGYSIENGRARADDDHQTYP